MSSVGHNHQRSPGVGKDLQSLREYLSLGFIPDADLASDYIHELFEVPGTQPGDPAKLLIAIVADLTAGKSNLVIPLSGGRDSRALLGAALHLFSNRDIHCLTFGSQGSADVEGAKVVCRSAQVSHQVIDPDTLSWDLDALTAEMKRRLERRMGVPPVDGMLVFGRLAEMIPSGSCVLSGYLGDATIGRHLKHGNAALENSQVLDHFYLQNHAELQEQPDATFLQFLETHGRLLQFWPSLTKFDLLDFGFRQRLRIRSSVSGSFSRPARPYEDRRWIAHWFSRPLGERLDRSKYDEALASAFPAIFGPLPLGLRFRRWRGRTRGRGSYRGDPRRNPSMASALEEACRAFDKRNIVGEAATAAFNEIMRRPNLAAFRKVRWFATTEIVARALDQAELGENISPSGG